MYGVEDEGAGVDNGVGEPERPGHAMQFEGGDLAFSPGVVLHTHADAGEDGSPEQHEGGPGGGPGGIPGRGLAAEPGLAGQEHRSNENDCQRDGYPAGHQLDLDRRVGAAVGVASAPPEGGVVPAASGVGDGVDAARPPGAAMAAAGGGGPGSSFLPVSPVQVPYAASQLRTQRPKERKR